MAIVTRATLKTYFTNGNAASAQNYADMIDSFVHRGDSTSQSMNSDIVAPNLIVTTLSANTGSITGRVQTSAATFTGRIRQGVSAAASAADSRGDMIVAQETTVAGAATAQVAFLPDANIVGFTFKVLVQSSGGAGGIKFQIGITGDRTYFGTQSTSALGMYDMTLVSASRLTGASGAVFAVMSGASAAANAIITTRYYQRT